MSKPNRLRDYTDAQFKEIVTLSTSYADVARKIGIRPGGTNQHYIKRRIASLGIDISHFPPSPIPRKELTPEEARPRRRGGRWLNDISDEEFIEIANHAKNYSHFSKLLGRNWDGGSLSEYIDARAEKLGVDLSHFIYERKSRAQGPHHRKLETLLVKGGDSTIYSKAKLRRRIVAEGLLEDRCAVCGTGPEWQGQPLELALHCKNLDYSDMRLENLEILCWNCRQQKVHHQFADRGRMAVKARKENLERKAYAKLLNGDV